MSLTFTTANNCDIELTSLDPIEIDQSNQEDISDGYCCPDSFTDGFCCPDSDHGQNLTTKTHQLVVGDSDDQNPDSFTTKYLL